MPTNKLTDLKIRQARPKDKPYKLADGEGMYLLIDAAGNRYWRLDYRFAGKRKTLALGTYPEIPLDKARKERDRARERIREGIDPGAERKTKKATARIQATDGTFEAVAREQLFGVALKYECWIDSPPASDPEAADIQRAGVLASLSSALILYDNYLSAIMLYRNDAKLRRHLNRPDPGFALPADELRKADHLYNSSGIRQRVRRAIRWYLDHGETESGLEGYDYLFQSIAQSPSFQLVRRKRPLHVLGRAFEIFGDYTLDSLVQLKNSGSHVTSLLFGNTAGLVETRRGKLHDKPELEKTLRSELQAGDILLEKTPFRLTDALIPGY